MMQCYKTHVLNAQSLSKQPNWKIVKSKMLRTRIKYFNGTNFLGYKISRILRILGQPRNLVPTKTHFYGCPRKRIHFCL